MLVGVGTARQRCEDPVEAVDALELMRRAALGAGPPALLERAGLVLVPRGTWKYADPGRALCPSARTVVAQLGVLQQTLMTRACAEIASGAVDVALVAGGEDRHRWLRAKITGASLPETVPGLPPDEVMEPKEDILSPLESERGLILPVRQYAVLETALRAAEGVSPAEHARELDRLWSAFHSVATDPVAGRKDMLSFPYRKWHCSQWNVDQAAALIFCSAGFARSLGIPRDQWVFPLAAAESNVMIPMTARPSLHRSPGFAAVGAALADLTGISAPDVDHLDLYSCFPSAVRIQARELGVTGRDDLTVTGGMPFAGGPLNNYALQATAEMARVLLEDPESTGLVTSVSGMLTKQAAGLWSCRPHESGFRWEDVTPGTEAVPLVAGYTGQGVVDGYTVTYENATPAQAIAVVSAPGVRTVATSREPLTSMIEEEWVGRPVEVRDGHFF
ncbi:acetyl-CoA acetyltransferase [Sphaerisporangium flaviroseum]|uniref:Acetyl-CoA acetyltransferase n=1 Tax=Sphaerisporangium flaviroseum TaxID=509199 RepID=A0ABP7IUH9_9ACTN